MVRVSYLEKTNKATENIRSVKIVSATYAGDYALRFVFNNGIERVVDFKPFLDANSKASMYAELLKPAKFKKFTYTPYSIDWNNVMTFGAVDIYLNALLKSEYRNYL